jgi:hypothetical protein
LFLGLGFGKKVVFSFSLLIIINNNNKWKKQLKQKEVWQQIFLDQSDVPKMSFLWID